MITFSDILGLLGSTPFLGNSVALKPGLDGLRDVASVIISHSQTQSNRVC